MARTEGNLFVRGCRPRAWRWIPLTIVTDHKQCNRWRLLLMPGAHGGGTSDKCMFRIQNPPGRSWKPWRAKVAYPPFRSDFAPAATGSPARIGLRDRHQLCLLDFSRVQAAADTVGT